MRADTTEPLLQLQPTTTATTHRQPEEEGLRQRRQRRDSRLLDRDAAFHQSRGRWQVQHVSRGAAAQLSALRGGVKQFWGNWFYTLAYQRTVVLMLILFSTYTAVVFFYAAIYRFVSQIGQNTQTDPVDPDSGSSGSTQCFCDMDIHDHMEALYFSLSTMTTIGYGVSDYYFGGCWTPLLLVLTQVCTAITFDAVAVGLLFQRMSRGQKRGKTVLFSNTAVVKRVRGRLYLQFRIAELRSHQLLEASVRAYCVRQERHLAPSIPGESGRIGDGNVVQSSPVPVVQTTHFVTKPMKLQHEDVSSHILMSLPQVIVHAIDEHSPLLPPAVWYEADGQRHQYPQLQKDSTDALESAKSNEYVPVQSQHKEIVERFVQDRQTEIIVLVEGSDELTGAVIQTRHSYTYRDLAWNQSFLPCVFPYSEEDDNDGGDDESVGDQSLTGPRSWNVFGRHALEDHRSPTKACVIDFAKFHETAMAPEDADGCPYVVE